MFVDAYQPVVLRWFPVGIPGFVNGLLPVCMFAGPIQVNDDDGKLVVVDTNLGWDTDPADLHDRLVVHFTESVTRPALHQEMQMMVASLEQLAPCALILVSGAFVTEDTDPEDLHLAAIVHGSAVAEMSGHDAWLLNRTFDDREQEFASGLTVTTQLAQVFPPGHERYEDTLHSLATLRYVCDRPRRGENTVAGYVQFVQCEGGGPDAEVFNFIAGPASSA